MRKQSKTEAKQPKNIKLVKNQSILEIADQDYIELRKRLNACFTIRPQNITESELIDKLRLDIEAELEAISYLRNIAEQN